MRDEGRRGLRRALLYACVKRLGESAGDPVFAAHDSAPNALAGVVVLGVKPLAAAKRVRARGDLHAPLALRLEPTLLSLGLLLARRHRRDVRPLLVRGMTVVARSHAPGPRLKHEAAADKGVEQRAVVRDQDPDAAVGEKRVEHACAGGGVEVVGGLVHHEDVWAVP
jgi:hypothetical protein